MFYDFTVIRFCDDTDKQFSVFDEIKAKVRVVIHELLVFKP